MSEAAFSFVDKALEIFHDSIQEFDEWLDRRLGIPTASRIADVMAGGEGKVRSKYMRQLAGERITGLPREETYKSAAMERGNEHGGRIAQPLCLAEHAKNPWLAALPNASCPLALLVARPIPYLVSMEFSKSNRPRPTC